MIIALILFILFVISIDFFSFLGIKRLTSRLKDTTRSRILKSYLIFGFAFIAFAITFSLMIHFSNDQDFEKYRNFFWIFGFFMAIYFPKILFITFIIIDFLIAFIVFVLKKTIFRNNMVWITKFSGFKIFSKTGIVAAFLFFVIIIYGIFIGRTNFEVSHVVVKSQKLPESFENFKIAQISDLHLGSFRDTNDVKKGLDLLMSQHPDMIVFTGDMVNNESMEAEIMIPIFKRLTAPYGKFSIMGNHDMGDYRRWYTIEEKNENLNNLIEIQKKMGFVPLLNENVIIKKGNDSIALAGVMNWGKPPFKCYGDLKKAIANISSVPYKVLLSHDPSHWDAQVLNKTDIVLTLSGHTHAMQMGINCCGIFWSPISLKYSRWAGLYNEKDQYLYVNRGFGFIGFPGRIGMTPEITIIELRK